MTDTARQNETANAITHNFLGDLDALRVMNTQKGQFARFKIVRGGDKRVQYAKMPQKTLNRYNLDLANGVFGDNKLDFGGYFVKQSYKTQDGETKMGSVFVVISIRPAKSREEIQALRAAKRERQAVEA